VPRYLTCTLDPVATVSQSPCTDDASGSYVVTVTDNIDEGIVNFDNSSMLFEFGLVTVIAFWAVGIVVGSILSVIRRG
jgi:hypothetical protein